MWWPTHARDPFATQQVLFSSPPAASSGRRAGSGSASALGTAPRERRTHTGVRPGMVRRTESSTRMWIGRSCTRNRSAIPRQACERVVVLVRDRLVGAVAARHHQRSTSGVAQQELMQGRRGQHHAEVGAARGNGRRDRRITADLYISAMYRSAVVPARGEDDRRERTREQRLVGTGEVHERPRGRQRRRHQRERLVLAVLARAQGGNRALVFGAAGEVVAAEALDRDDLTGAQRGGRLRDRVDAGPATRRVPVGVDQLRPRPAPCGEPPRPQRAQAGSARPRSRSPGRGWRGTRTWALLRRAT